ncbi:hypothetical protein RND81_01G157000 [Saponaria officinalis]|uniref:Reverse transcriptase zinc-binding domain-containing protein n=1 Tax=Saponaria officinalis TaxID=3572 RepID=A0AAW1NG82_SAPOF
MWLTSEMYNGLLSKIMTVIPHWSVNLLTYAGKVQLINSVVFGLQSFWCASILLPKIVVNQINKMCRNFFWSSDTRTRLVFKSWSSMCLPRTEGGFDIREILAWNKALLAKLLWNLDRKSSGIWVTWIHAYYLNKADIWRIAPSSVHSESFRSILKIRDLCIDKLGTIISAQTWLRNCLSATGFSVSKAYDLFRDRGNSIPWACVLHGKAIIPSHGLISTLAGQRKLPTIDSLCQRGIYLINRCCLCKNHCESHRHLFFNCSYSKEVWNAMISWMSLSHRSAYLISELYWTQRRGKKKHWKTNWFRGSLSATVYYLWSERNNRIFEGRERGSAQLSLSSLLNM